MCEGQTLKNCSLNSINRLQQQQKEDRSSVSYSSRSQNKRKRKKCKAQQVNILFICGVFNSMCWLITAAWNHKELLHCNDTQIHEWTWKQYVLLYCTELQTTVKKNSYMKRFVVVFSFGFKCQTATVCNLHAVCWYFNGRWIHYIELGPGYGDLYQISRILHTDNTTTLKR